MQGELEGYVIRFCHWAAGLIKWKGALPIVFGFIVHRPEPQDEEDEERMGRGSAARALCCLEDDGIASFTMKPINT